MTYMSDQQAASSMQFVYKAQIVEDPFGGLLITFDDVPEVVSFGRNRDEVMEDASEALGLALRGYLVRGANLPVPRAVEGIDVAVNPVDAIKIAVINRFHATGITKTELARRIGKSEGEARRILDPDHPSKITAMQAAIRAMGQTIVISVMQAA